MQPDLPEPSERPGRSPFDDLRERLARLPASHPSAPGYRDWPDEPTERAARAGGGPPPGGGRPDRAAAPDDAAIWDDVVITDDAAGPDDATGADVPAEPDDAGEPDGTGGDSEADQAGPGGPDSGRGPATQRPGRGGRAGGTAVGYLPGDGGDGPYRPWFSGEPPQPWFTDPAGHSG